ncbi:hypothetical protein PAPHI01_2587 [Pancytospora philotis]|nr:hypothetical protein PAPHI01_2587 [Pancytospora philotis]
MIQGVCAFSGQNIPRGSGIHRVGVDTKVVFAWGKREHNYISTKTSARSIKWTEASRSFFNKTHSNEGAKNEFVPITKVVRGFSLIPKGMISQAAPKVVEKKVKADGKNGKVYKNSNVSARK